MKLKISPLMQKILPASIAAKVAPHLLKADEIIGGESDSAVSGRIALFAFAIRIFSAAIAYISQVILVRWMGAFEYGIFIAVWVTAVILGGIACLGFQTGVIRFISEYQSSKDDDHLRGAIFGSLLWSRYRLNPHSKRWKLRNLSFWRFLLQLLHCTNLSGSNLPANACSTRSIGRHCPRS